MFSTKEYYQINGISLACSTLFMGELKAVLDDTATLQITKTIEVQLAVDD